MLLALRILYQPDGMKFSLQTFAALLFCALPAFVLGRIIRGTGSDIKKITLVFTGLFAGSAVPGSVFFLNNINDIRGHVFFYSNLFFILCVVHAFISAGKHGEKWIIPFTFFACAAVNPSFLVLYLPAVLVLLIFNIYSGTAQGEDKLLLGASLAAAAAGVLVFGRDTVLAGFTGFSALIESNWKNLAYSIFILAPLFIIFSALWINMLRLSKTKSLTFTVILIMVLPLLSVFALVIGNNYMDTVMAYAFAQFCFFFYFAYIKNAAFIAALKKAAVSFEKNPVPLLMVLVYLAAFSVFRFDSDIVRWLGL